jgi:GNAT superfamily N-acetyltransferase
MTLSPPAPGAQAKRDDQVSIRPARESDAETLGQLAAELLDYETGSDSSAQAMLSGLVGKDSAFRRNLFGPERRATAYVADAGSHALVGFSLGCESPSAFLARPGILMEGLYVRQDWRGLQIGRRLMGALAREALRGGGFLEWRLVRSNTAADGFYQSLGAARIDDFCAFRLEGEALTHLTRAR